MPNDIKAEIVQGTVDIFEAIIDQTLDDSLLNDIPIIGTAVKLAYIGKSIKDILFLEKVKRFLFSLPKLSESKKKDFYSKMNENQEFKKKVGEVLLLTIERLDNLDKASTLAKVFGYFVQGKITFNQFHRLSSAIDNAFIGDIIQLVRLPVETYGHNRNYMSELVRTGLTEYVPSANERDPGIFEGPRKIDVKMDLKISDLGKLFEMIMKDKL